jgi:DNA-binding NarL/FixJ family response regulator
MVPSNQKCQEMDRSESPANIVGRLGIEAMGARRVSKTCYAASTYTERYLMESKGIAEVFLLAENRLLREALIRILTTKNNIRVVGAAPFSSTAPEKISTIRPHIVLLDSIGLVFSETRLLSVLRATIPDVRVILVDMEPDQATFLRAVQEGVVGYVLKDASAAEVVSTISAVAAGEAVCPPCLSMALFRCVARHCKTPTGSTRLLSRRELELMPLLRERLTNKEIAARLNLSEQTVKNHVHHILRKVGAPDRLAIVERSHSGDLTGLAKGTWAS